MLADYPDLFTHHNALYPHMQRILLLFSDGSDTASKFADAERARKQLAACEVRAMAVGVGTELDASALKEIAGKDVFLAPDKSSLATVFEQAAASLNARYAYRVVTPEPVYVSASTSLTVEYDGKTVTGVYEVPTESCDDVMKEQLDACKAVQNCPTPPSDG